jgi:hypothetical protein
MRRAVGQQIGTSDLNNQTADATKARLTMLGTTTPTEITEAVLRFCVAIDPAQTPLVLRPEPDPNQRVGLREGQTVVVDRGMSGEENLEKIRARGLHYLVAAPYSECQDWVEEFQDAAEFDEVRRELSPRNPFQQQSTIQVKRRQAGGETHVLCVSSERKEKDRAIRQAHPSMPRSNG